MSSSSLEVLLDAMYVLGWIACETRVLYLKKLGSCRERSGKIKDGTFYNRSQPPPSASMHCGQPFCGTVSYDVEASYPSILPTTDY